MPLYYAHIDWTSDPGNRVVVGIYDNLDTIIEATRDYYEQVRGESNMHVLPAWSHPVYNTQIIPITFTREMPAEGDQPAYTITGSAAIWETPLNVMFPGSIMAATE